MPLLLDGKKARDFYKKALLKRASALPTKPILALLQIGHNPESDIYIEQKKKFGKSIGVEVMHIQFPTDVEEKTVIEKIKELNDDSHIKGIILQLPLPLHLKSQALIDHISPIKDVDGLTKENQALLAQGTPRFIPATAKGILLLLSFYNISVTGKKATVFGRSALVGRPIALLLKSKGASVEVCHSETQRPHDISKKADIVVVAVGKPGLIGASHLKEGAIVIDVGINSVKGDKLDEEIPKRKLVGDVNWDEATKTASAISPVPGGVGPMTVLSLFDNLIISAENSRG